MLSFIKNFLKKEPWASQSNMSAWLKHLPMGDTKQAQLTILEMLNGYFKSDDSLHLHCFSAMWLLSECVEVIIQQLVQHYLQNYKISVSTERAIWDNLFEITQRLSQIYEPILEFNVPLLIKALGAEGTARSIAYFIHYKSIQAKIRLFRFEQWVPAQWEQLHRSFILAEQMGVNRYHLSLFKSEEQGDIPESITIEVEYAHLLLLQLLNIGSFEPNHIQQAHIWLMIYAPNIQVEKEPHAEGFVLDLELKEGLVRAFKIAEKTQANHSYSLRYINTYSIINRIQTELETTRELLLETRDSSFLNATLVLLEKCYRLWNHNQHYWERNGNRERAAGNFVWVIDSWQFIFQAIPPIPGSESYVPPSVPVYNVADQYAMIDKSTSGYGLIGQVNESRPFKLGMLILVYEEQYPDHWNLCVLRRLKKLGIEQAEMGVEILACYICSMRPIKNKKALTFHGLDGYEIDVGEHRSEAEYIQTLYVRPQENTKAGNVPSLFILKRDYYSYSGQKFPLHLESGLFTITLGNVIEETNDWIWCSLKAEQHQEMSE